MPSVGAASTSLLRKPSPQFFGRQAALLHQELGYGSDDAATALLLFLEGPESSQDVFTPGRPRRCGRSARRAAPWSDVIPPVARRLRRRTAAGSQFLPRERGDLARMLPPRHGGKLHELRPAVVAGEDRRFDLPLGRDADDDPSA